MTKIRDNLQIIGANIEQYLAEYKCPKASVQLLAVSKRHPSDKIKEAYEAGQRAFGENYVQELLDKKSQLHELDIEWHFIGPLQSNKTKKIAEAANWVHAVDRLKIAQRLSEQRSETLAPLSICLQVNVSEESSKSGLKPSEVVELALQIVKLPHLRLRGLMAIPAPEDDFEKQRKEVQQTFKSNDIDIELDTLSMGMSNDMEAAIAEGATIVRIGTAIFGQRET
ncbi:UNVERIFIED_CONTAM: hypothetical protein GTU68_027644 [Idotea baltica]|nr:hypothetical protein [Idotea baltica]